MQELHRIHNGLTKHAFNCFAVLREAYNEASDLGYFAARKHAIRKHDESVRWVHANVGLD